LPRVPVSVLEKVEEKDTRLAPLYLNVYSRVLMPFKSTINEKNEMIEPKYTYLVFADTEATTDGETHKPFCVAYTMAKLEVKDGDKIELGKFSQIACLYGRSSISQFMSVMPKGAVIYFHNLKYDFAYVRPYLTNMSVLAKDGQYYAAEGNYMGNSLYFRDSYKMIPSPLRDFPEAFKLKGLVKEVFPYTFYREDNVFSHDRAYIEEACQHLKPEDIEDFKANHEKVLGGLRMGYLDRRVYSKRGYFNKEEYAKFYCRQDVRILRDGFLRYRDVMYEIMELDTLMFFTLSSISDTYLIKRGVYENVYELSGMPRKFIQECCKGGRVMCRDNEKQLADGEIEYFDAVSLYPSAMERLTKDGYGIPAGVPIPIKDKEEFEKIRTDSRTTSFFIKIRVTKVGRELHMPILSTKIKGVRCYTNKVKDVYYCDRIEFEDLLKFHQIEYEFIEGYMFNGNNLKVGEVIRHLFDYRLKAKAEDPQGPMQECLKKCMNSSYGKNGLKESNTKTKYFDKEEEFTAYRKKHSAEIVSATIYGNKYEVIIGVPSFAHFNRCHVSSVILSMSKRIMNEVICLAEELDVSIYYQDTDSMFLRRSDLSKLCVQYGERYNKVLVGKNMGQFHCDFVLKDAIDPHSVLSIFLGKKFHAHHVEGNTKSGDKVRLDHIRSKGFPDTCLKRKANREKFQIEGKEESYTMGFYYRLYLGDKFILDITDKDGPSIRASGSYNRTMRSVPRTAFFPNPPKLFINRLGQIVPVDD
jgi:hypothetical protein